MDDPEEDSREKWTAIGSEFNFPQLDHLEGEGVNIQCVNSSEFVVGKQTNFNGPVTIINCQSPKVSDHAQEPKEEKVVIRDKVLSQSAMMTVEELAKNGKREGPSLKAPKPKFIRTWMIVSFAAIVFLAAAAVSVVVMLDTQKVTDPALPRCERLSTNVCLYSEFSFATENNDTRPLTVRVPYVFISQTFGNFCYDFDECLIQVKLWFEKNTPCNFLLGGDGNVYEDLGWNEETPLVNPKAIRICFVGDYTEWEIPTYPQVEAAKILIEFALKNGYLANDYVLAPSTENLGSLYEPPNNFTRRFYSKTDWGGQPAKSYILMKVPIPYVVVSHSASSQCSSLSTCSPLIRGMQKYHQSISFADIAYNFLVDSSGNVYEGRGWVKRNVKGGFTNGRNVDVCVIGDFSQSTHPTEEQMNGLRILVEFGVESGYLSPDYSLIAANETYATLSPGIHVYEVIKDWPNFDPDPRSHVKDFE